MAWNRRAQEAGGYIIWFALFYSLLTAAIILFLVTIPKSLLETSIQPIELDAAIQAQMITSKLWTTNQYTGATSPFDYTSDLSIINQTSARKYLTYKVSIDGKEGYYEKDFYEIAQPLAPFKYMPYTSATTVTVNGKPARLQIEEYYPKKYELKT